MDQQILTDVMGLGSVAKHKSQSGSLKNERDRITNAHAMSAQPHWNTPGFINEIQLPRRVSPWRSINLFGRFQIPFDFQLHK